MPTWRDEQLPPDETLRVLAGGEPSLKFRAKHALLGVLGYSVGALIAIAFIAAFIGFTGSDRWVVIGLCLVSLIGGIFIGGTAK